MTIIDSLLFSVNVILFQNIILSNFFGVCTFFTPFYRNRPLHTIYFGTAFVLTINSIATYLVYTNFLVPFGLDYLYILVFALMSFIFIQCTEIVTKKFTNLFSLRISSYLPLIVSNCLLLGVSLYIIRQDFSLFEVILFCIVASFGYTFTLYSSSFILDRIDKLNIIEPAKGMPIGFLILAIISLTFNGLMG